MRDTSAFSARTGVVKLAPVAKRSRNYLPRTQREKGGDMIADGAARMLASRLGAGSIGLMLAALLAGAASAAELPSDTPPASPESPATADAGGWQFDLASYGWFSGFKGSTATLPPLPAASVDLSFGDILSELDGAVMGVAYARHERMVLYGDLMYSRLSLSESFATSLSTSLKLTTSSLIASAGAGYTVLADPRYELDLLGGARLYNVDTDATLSLLGTGITKRGSTDETWVDPMIGARFSAELTDSLYLTSWAFAGGFDVGSKFSWDLFGGLGYKLSDRYTVIAGYRGLGVDYEHGGYKYDVVQKGPIAGLKIHF
jgi:opacity protein-like surface antigen